MFKAKIIALDVIEEKAQGYGNEIDAEEPLIYICGDLQKFLKEIVERSNAAVNCQPQLHNIGLSCHL